MHQWDTTLPRQVEVIKGACLLLRKDALDQVGLLDEDYFMYTEEVDLCLRLAQAGWQLWWVPQAEVIHHEAQSTRQVAEEMYIQLYRSKVQFYRKFGGPATAQRFKYLLRLAYLPRYAFSRLGSLLSPSLSTRASTYSRLLTSLADM
jgi:GT2 family glycosyltransferase